MIRELTQGAGVTRAIEARTEQHSSCFGCESMPGPRVSQLQWCLPPLCAVFFGVTCAVALKFYEAAPAAGLLLLPLLGYAAFGALLLNLCMGDGSASVEVGLHPS